MGHGQFDSVEVAAAAAIGRGGVLVDDAGDLGIGGGESDLARDLGEIAGGADDLGADLLGGAGVAELGEHPAALRVDRLGQALVAGDDRFVDVPQADLRPHLGRGDRSGAGDLHAEAGSCPFAVIGDVAVGHLSSGGKSGLVRGQVEPGSQGERSDRDRAVDGRQCHG